MEATAVMPEGHIWSADAGRWTESQIALLKRLVDFSLLQAAKIGVQLAHGGSKVSELAMWVESNANRTRRVVTSTAFANENALAELF